MPPQRDYKLPYSDNVKTRNNITQLPSWLNPITGSNARKPGYIEMMYTEFEITVEPSTLLDPPKT